MKSRLWLVAAVLTGIIMLALTGHLLAFHGESPLEGAYEYVRSESPQGTSSGQVGMLVIKGDHLCHLRVAKDREKTVRDESEEERNRKYASAFRGSNGTCGKIAVDGEKVTATWGVSLDPNDEGNVSEFIFAQDGEELTISPAGAPDFKFVYKKVD